MEVDLVQADIGVTKWVAPAARVPLNHDGPPCSSQAWPCMAAGSDRFWLLELRVSRTFLDNLRLQLLRPWIPNSARGIDGRPRRSTEVVLNEQSPFGRPEVCR